MGPVPASVGVELGEPVAQEVVVDRDEDRARLARDLAHAPVEDVKHRERALPHDAVPEVAGPVRGVVDGADQERGIGKAAYGFLRLSSAPLATNSDRLHPASSSPTPRPSPSATRLRVSKRGRWRPRSSLEITA